MAASSLFMFVFNSYATPGSVNARGAGKNKLLAYSCGDPGNLVVTLYGWVLGLMLPLAFTGHRKFNNKYIVPAQVLSNLRQAIKKASRWGFDEFRCGMAVGFDSACADIVLENRLPLHAYVAFKGMELKWPEAAQKKYQDYLKSATQVRYVSTPPFYSWKMILRDKVMVKDTSLVITAWDGREDGGTWTTLQYARDLGIPILNVYNGLDWITSNPYE